MHLLSPAQAVSEIVQAVTDPDFPARFFFMLGAGISVPSVPLARQIQEHCMSKAKVAGHETPTSDLLPIETYSYWFEKAFPNRIQRQQYLRSLIEDKPISAANLRLAHLLSKNAISHKVVTVNFDDHLAKALRLFGCNVSVCDDPAIANRFDIASQDIQILHIHGSYLSYDCCNLTGEIAHNAQPAPDTSRTMATKLDSILTSEYMPIVIGYSGWETDVFMSALQRRLNNQNLPTHIYWFLYSETEQDSLPHWLTSHRDVRIVSQQRPSHKSATSAPKTIDEICVWVEASIASAEGEVYLSATRVLSQFIEALNIDVPDLIRNPHEFFADYLESLSSAQEGPTYSLESVILKLRSPYSDQPLDPLFELRRAAQRSQQDAILTELKELKLDEMNSSYLIELIHLLWANQEDLSDPSQNWLPVSDALLAAYEHLKRLGSDLAEVRLTIAKALHNKAVILNELGRSEEAISTHESVIDGFQEDADEKMQKLISSQMYNQGYIAHEMGDLERAIDLYRRCEKTFVGKSNLDIRGDVARAMFNMGNAYSASGDESSASVVWDDLIERESIPCPEPVCEPLAKAYVNRANRYRADEDYDNALQYLDIVLDSFSEENSAAVNDPIARALLCKVAHFLETENFDEANSVFASLCERFFDATDPDVLSVVQIAFDLILSYISKNEELTISDELKLDFLDILDRLGEGPQSPNSMQAKFWAGLIAESNDDMAKAERMYSENIEAYKNHPAVDEGIAGLVARSIYNRGALYRDTERVEEGNAEWHRLVDMFDASPFESVAEPLSKALVNIAHEKVEEGKAEEALSEFDHAIERFSDNSEPAVQGAVANAYRLKGECLIEEGRSEEAKVVLNELLEHWGDRKHPETETYVEIAKEALETLSE